MNELEIAKSLFKMVLKQNPETIGLFLDMIGEVIFELDIEDKELTEKSDECAERLKTFLLNQNPQP
jgi:hypothetical protein